MFVKLPGWPTDVQDGGRREEVAAGGCRVDYYYQLFGFDSQPAFSGGCEAWSGTNYMRIIQAGELGHAREPFNGYTALEGDCEFVTDGEGAALAENN